MRYIIILALALFSFNASAQKHVIGLRGGLNMANYTFDNMIKDQTDFIPRATAGITYEYMLTEKLSIGIDAMYNQRGQLVSVTFTDEQGTVVGNGEMRHEMEYISTPIKIAYKTSGMLYGFGSIGFLPSFLSKSSLNFSGDFIFPVTYEHEMVNTKSYESIDLGGIAELGGGYRTAFGLSVYAAIGYQHSFTKTIEQEFIPSYTIQHYGIMASLGVKYALGK